MEGGRGGGGGCNFIFEADLSIFTFPFLLDPPLGYE